MASSARGSNEYVTPDTGECVAMHSHCDDIMPRLPPRSSAAILSLSRWPTLAWLAMTGAMPLYFERR